MTQMKKKKPTIENQNEEEKYKVKSITSMSVYLSLSPYVESKNEDKVLQH